MASTIPVIVQGNSFSLAIPLQIYYINGDQMDLQDYTPDPTDEVSVQLKGSRRNYTYTPTIDGNVANIDLTGNELADNYGVVVSVVKANGQRLRSFRTDQFFIVESSDDLTVDDIIEGLEENVIYLNSSIFVAGEDGRGITSIVKTSTAGLVDTYTITYSDNTTSTFDVTNGAQGEAGATIASVEKTATVGKVDTYTITMTDGNTFNFEVTNGLDGVDLGLANIVNDLTTGGATNVLSAEMGKNLNSDIHGGNYTKTLTWSSGFINKTTGVIKTSSSSIFSQPFILPQGDTLTVTTANASICIIGSTTQNSLALNDTVNVIQITGTSGAEETHTITPAEKDMKLVVCVKASDYSITFTHGGESIENTINEINTTFKSEIDYQSLSQSDRIIDANNTWATATQALSVLIPVTAGDRYLLKRVTNAGYMALLKSDTNYQSSGENLSVDFCENYPTRFLPVNSTTTSCVLVIPPDCNYIYTATVAGQSAVDTIIEKYLGFKDGIDEMKDSIKLSYNEITHLVPDNAGQLNAVKRMRQITDIKWTPAFDLPRLNWTTGGIWSRDVFKAGRTYKGIPYGRCQKKSASFGYDTFKVGQFVSFEAFITSVLNKNTALEKESEFNITNHESCYYSTVCAAAASYALGLGYVTSRQFPQRSDMTNLGYVNSGGSQFDLSLLKLGDVLSDPEVHTAMITDVVIDGEGTVKYVEVSESTPDGQENPNVYGTSEEGAPYGGTCQRFWWTPTDFYSHWGSYMVLRYQNIASVTYTPSPYVQIGKETAGYAPRLMACLPYMGNGFRYRVGYIPNTDIIINVTGYTKLRVLKDGEPWKYDNTTNYYDISGLDKIAVGFTQVGDYEAYICNIENGQEVQKSLHCKWSVVSNITPY